MTVYYHIECPRDGAQVVELDGVIRGIQVRCPVCHKLVRYHLREDDEERTARLRERQRIRVELLEELVERLDVGLSKGGPTQRWLRHALEQEKRRETGA